MNSLFGIGFAELVVILVLAGLLLGPHRIRQVARALGRLTAQLQTVSRQFTRQLHAELDALDVEEVKGAIEDVKELQRQVASLRREFYGASQEFVREGQTALREGQSVAGNEAPVKPDAFPANSIDPGAAKTPPPTTAEGLPLPRRVLVPDDPEE